MLAYLEFVLLFGVFAVAGVLVIANFKVERWGERWLERMSLQSSKKPPGPHVP